MKQSCGIDIVQISRFKETILKHGEATLDNPFIRRVFNEEEIAHILERSNPYPGLAGRFAAKEAVIKAMSDIKKIAELKSVRIIGEIPKANFEDHTISVSISHDGDYAVAMAILLHKN